MKIKAVIAGLIIAGALIWWNFQEFNNLKPETDRIVPIDAPISVDLPKFDWKWCDSVDVEVVDGVCRILSMPPELTEMDGQQVVVSGPSFACGEDLVERKDGYTIKGFIMVPYFGMIDCCVGNPIPYFQWTIVVEQLKTPWEINHKGIINPDVVVSGTLRIVRKDAREGIFFIDDAEIIYSAEQEAGEQRLGNP